MLDTILHGLLPLPIWGYVVVTLAMTHLTVLGVTIFLHRCQAHRALTLHPVVSHVFRFWLWLTTGIVTREWVAVHRKHHAKTETPEDPHSPKVEGLWRVVFNGVGLYRRATSDRAMVERYGRGTPEDWIERRLYSAHPLGGILLMLGIDLVLFGAAGAAIWAVQMIWIPFWAAGVVNGIGHAFGYRNFDTRDTSTNIVPWGVIMGGEELHNNHHARPGSPRLSHHWWELDIAWGYLRVLTLLGLARPKSLATTPRTAAKDDPVVDPLSADVASERFVRDVILPWISSEIGRADRALRTRMRECRTWLERPGRSPEEAARMLAEWAPAGGAFETLVGHWRTLRETCRGIAAGSVESRRALEAWLRNAASSGIDPLEEFARTLEVELAMQPA